MKSTLGCALCALSLITASGAVNADLILPLESRLDGQAVYDPNSNLTWLADANYAKTSGYDSNGQMNWSDANAWADSLTIGGFSDWRLPSTAQPNAGCYSEYANGQDYGSGCTISEMGYLFYISLGGEKDKPITSTSSHNDNFDLFSNVQASYYWSATEHPTFTDRAWTFYMGNGVEYKPLKTNIYFAWAVRSGDVGASSAVPEPTALSLIGIGTVGLFAARSRGARATQRTYG